RARGGGVLARPAAAERLAAREARRPGGPELPLRARGAADRRPRRVRRARSARAADLLQLQRRRVVPPAIRVGAAPLSPPAVRRGPPVGEGGARGGTRDRLRSRAAGGPLPRLGRK